MSSERFRLRFTFWLDMTKGEQAKIADTIDTLKADRAFAPTVREGIQLITSLRGGDVQLLFELFPWIKLEMVEHFQEIGLIPPGVTAIQADKATSTPAAPATSAPAPATEHARQALHDEKQHIEQLRAEQAAYEEEMRQWADKKEAQIAAQWEHIEREKARLAAERERNQSAIEKKLEKLEQMLLAQGNRPMNRPSSSRGGGLRPVGGGGSSGPASLGAPDLPPPNFDDDDDDLLTVEKDDGSTSNANLNFIRSVQKLMEL